MLECVVRHTKNHAELCWLCKAGNILHRNYMNAHARLLSCVSCGCSEHSLCKSSKINTTCQQGAIPAYTTGAVYVLCLVADGRKPGRMAESFEQKP